MIIKIIIKSLILMIILCCMVFVGCTTKDPSTNQSSSATQFKTGMYSPMFDNFIILFDAGASMKNQIKDETKLEVAKAIVKNLNETIPELGQTAGLRCCGHASEKPNEHTCLFYGMAKYSTNDLGSHINRIKCGGSSHFDKAFEAVLKDLEEFYAANNAIIIISDGLNINKAALAGAHQLKERFGPSICFYAIHVGDKPVGKRNLQKITRIGDCGLYQGYEGLSTNAGMVAFVESELLLKKTAE